MSVVVSNIIRNATNHNQPLNVLWMAHDGIFESMIFGHTPLNQYYGMIKSSYTQWDIKLYPPASNFHPLISYQHLPSGINFDLIVINNKLDQLTIAQNVSQILHLPILIIDHMIPLPIIKAEDMYLLAEKTQKCQMVVTHPIINERWNTNHTIFPYGIPELPNEDTKENKAIIIGKFEHNDYTLIKRLLAVSEIPIKIIGDNPGLSTSHVDILHEMKTSRYIINLTNTLCLPNMLLFAMSFGCIPITNKTPFTQQLINHNNGWLFEDLSHITNILNQTHNNLDEKSQNAINTIRTNFDINKNMEVWIKTFIEHSNQVFIR